MLDTHTRMFKKLLSIFLHHEFIFLTLFGNSFILVSATVFYFIERNHNTSIRSFVDALWWALITMTTVGYGDIVPVTNLGRIVAFTTIMVGLSVVALFTAVIVRHFLSKDIDAE